MRACVVGLWQETAMAHSYEVSQSGVDRGSGLGAHPLSPGLSSTHGSATASVKSDELPTDAISADAYRFSSPSCGSSWSATNELVS